VPKLVWRVKLVAEFETGETTEVEVAHLERDEQAGLADLGLRLGEAKRLTAAIQAEIVPAQVTIASENRRTCLACGRVLASKGHYTATFRSLFGDVPIRVRRLLACSCQGAGEAKSFAGFDLEAATVAPELAYVTARYAALAPFGQVATLLSELLPISGAPNAGTVRNRTLRVGETVVQPRAANMTKPTEPVVVGLDGGYVRSRQRQEERHFEVVAGKVIDADGIQSRFAFARNGPMIASDAFKQALDVAGVRVGLATCYDVRFPELHVELARRGAQVLTVHASWGSGPGKLEQWTLLNRARAIDTSSVVAAVGQAHPDDPAIAAVGPTGVGGSLVASPTGEVLASAGSDPQLLVSDVDLHTVDAARETIAVLRNRQEFAKPLGQNR